MADVRTVPYVTLLMMHSSVMMFVILHPLHEADMLLLYLLTCISERSAAEISNCHSSIGIAALAVSVIL